MLLLKLTGKGPYMESLGLFVKLVIISILILLVFMGIPYFTIGLLGVIDILNKEDTVSLQNIGGLIDMILGFVVMHRLWNSTEPELDKAIKNDYNKM